MKHSDDWIEDRIRWRGRQYKLPSGGVSFFPDAPADVQQVVTDATFTFNMGRPVLLAYKSAARWTLIATRQLVGSVERLLRRVAYVDIVSLLPSDYPPDNWSAMSTEELLRWQQSWEFLRISTASGASDDFWAPAGRGAFAFVDILSMLTRMEACLRSFRMKRDGFFKILEDWV